MSIYSLPHTWHIESYVAPRPQTWNNNTDQFATDEQKWITIQKFNIQNRLDQHGCNPITAELP